MALGRRDRVIACKRPRVRLARRQKWSFAFGAVDNLHEHRRASLGVERIVIAPCHARDELAVYISSRRATPCPLRSRLGVISPYTSNTFSYSTTLLHCRFKKVEETMTEKSLHPEDDLPLTLTADLGCSNCSDQGWECQVAAGMPPGTQCLSCPSPAACSITSAYNGTLQARKV